MKLFAFLFLFIFSFSAFSQKVFNDVLFNQKLRLAREILTRPNATKLLSEILADDLTIEPNTVNSAFNLPPKKSISETQLLMLFDQNPDLLDDVEMYIKQVPKDAELDTKKMEIIRKKWHDKFTKIIADEELRKKFRKQNQPLEPYIVSNQSGYSQAKTYVNHKRIVDKAIIQPDNLKKVWIEQIRSAKKEIAICVFDFDLEDIALELIEAHKRGIKIKIGIDASVIEARPEVKKVFDMLTSKGVFVHPVNSVGLSHQKMMAIDWSISGEGKVVFSSGNLTQSCIGPEGDSGLLGKGKRSKFSIPNANHVITMKSDMASSIVAHEISKTVDAGFQLRGKDYPLGGVYKIWGTGKMANGDRPYIMLAFSPNGAMDGINKNLISQVILRTSGPVKMTQFAFSSYTINEALLARAKIDLAKTGEFIFKSVGDTPFAVQDWSIFLKMSGLELIRSEDKAIPPKYLELKESDWRKLLGDKQFEELKRQIKTAPKIYGQRYVTIDGKKVKLTSKIHHKLLITGPEGQKVTITGSFNFSTGAESNQEYVLIVYDQKVSKDLEGAMDYLHSQSNISVADEAGLRNTRRKFDAAMSADVDKPTKAKVRKATIPCGKIGAHLKAL